MVERNRTSRIMDDDQLKATFEDGSFIIDESNVPRSIYVTGFSRATNPDNLIIQFQKQRNGGGDIESIVINRKKGAAVITFDNEEVVQSIQQKEQKYEGAILSVKSYDAAFKKDEDSEEVLQRSRSPVLVQQPVNPLVKPGKISNEDRNENIQLSSGKQCRPVAMAGRSGTTKWTDAQQDTPESFQLGQKDREERSESDLERQRSAKGVLEQHGDDLQTMLVAKENKWQELENSLSAAQRALSECRSNNDVELRRLINEITRLERFEREQREREEHFESELQKERNAKEVSEQRAANLQTALTDKENQLQVALSHLNEIIERFELEQRERKEHFESELKKEKNAKEVSEQRAANLQTALTDKENQLQVALSHLSEIFERFELEQRERKEHFESELKKEKNAKEVSEQRAANLQTALTDKENQLEVALSHLNEIFERFELEQRERKEHFESELKKEKNAKEVSEQRAANLQTVLTDKENQLEVALSHLNEIFERFELEQRERKEHFESELKKEKNAKEVSEQRAANLQTALTDKENQLQVALSHLKEIFERFELEQRERKEHFESELKKEKNAKEVSEQRAANLQTALTDKENQLEVALSHLNEIFERFELEQREREEHFESELERERNGKEEAEQHAANLQTTLTATQNRVQELQRKQRNETRDWVLSRDEIHPSDKVVGKGAWATVYQGKFRGCKVAVKIIHELILSPYSRRLFEREMMIASACRHPCLLQFIGATNDDGNPLFVTELMESSLRTQLERGALSEADVTAISLDVAQALNYLHLKKPSPIIHRDISSANVLLWRQGELWRGKVSDYGTANFIRQTMTAGPGAIIYCAPEAFTPNQTIKMDVYSFGVLLCEMCIRELPDPQNREEQVTMVTHRMLQNIIRRCIKPRPEARPSMEEIIDELEAPATPSGLVALELKKKDEANRP